jgi:hypothetical protein
VKIAEIVSKGNSVTALAAARNDMRVQRDSIEADICEAW